MGLSKFLSSGKLDDFLLSDYVNESHITESSTTKSSITDVTPKPNLVITKGSSNFNKVYDAVDFILEAEVVSKIKMLYIAGQQICYIVKCDKILLFLGFAVPRFGILATGCILFEELYKKIFTDQPTYFNRITLSRIKATGFYIPCAYFLAWCATYFDNQISFSEPLYTSPYGNIDIIGAYCLMLKIFAHLISPFSLPLFKSYYKEEYENYQEEISKNLSEDDKEELLRLTNEIEEKRSKVIGIEEARSKVIDLSYQTPQVEGTKNIPRIESSDGNFYNVSKQNDATFCPITMEQEQELDHFDKSITEFDEERRHLIKSIKANKQGIKNIYDRVSGSIKKKQIQQIEDSLNGDLNPTLTKVLHLSPFWKNETTQDQFKFFGKIDESKKGDVEQKLANYSSSRALSQAPGNLDDNHGNDLNLLIKKYTAVLPSNATVEDILFDTAVFIYSKTNNVRIFSEENLKKLSGEIYYQKMLQTCISMEEMKENNKKEISVLKKIRERDASMFTWFFSELKRMTDYAMTPKNFLLFKQDIIKRIYGQETEKEEAHDYFSDKESKILKKLWQETSFLRKVQQDLSQLVYEPPFKVFENWFQKVIITKADFLIFVHSIYKKHELSKTQESYIAALRGSPNPVLHIEPYNTFIPKNILSDGLKSANLAIALFQQREIIKQPNVITLAISTVTNIFNGYQRHRIIEPQIEQNFGPIIQTKYYRDNNTDLLLSATPKINSWDKFGYLVTEVYSPKIHTADIIQSVTTSLIGTSSDLNGVPMKLLQGLLPQLLIPGLALIVIYNESRKNPSRIIMKVVFGFACCLAIDMFLKLFVNPNHTFTLNFLDPDFYKWETEQILLSNFHKTPYFFKLTKQAIGGGSSVWAQRHLFQHLHKHFFPERQIPYIRNITDKGNQTGTITNSVLSFIHVLWYKYPRLRYLFMDSNEQSYNLMIDLLCLSPAECPIPQHDNVPNLWNTLSPDAINCLIQIFGMKLVTTVPGVYIMAPLIALVSLFFCKFLPGEPPVRLEYNPLTTFTRLKLPDCLRTSEASAHIKIITILGHTKYDKAYQHKQNFFSNEEFSLVIVDCTHSNEKGAKTGTIPREFTVNNCNYRLLSFIEKDEEKNTFVTNMKYDDVNWVKFEDGKQLLKLKKVRETNRRVQFLMYENVTRELKVNLPFAKVVTKFIEDLQTSTEAKLITDNNKFQPHKNDHIRCEIYACVLAYLTITYPGRTQNDVDKMAETLKKEYSLEETIQSSDFQTNDYSFLSKMFSSMDTDFSENDSYSDKEKSMLLSDPAEDFKKKAEFIAKKLNCSLTIYLCRDIYSENGLIFDSMQFGTDLRYHLQIGCLYGAVSQHPKPIYHFFPLKKTVTE